MHHHKVILKSRLSGINRVPNLPGVEVPTAAPAPHPPSHSPEGRGEALAPPVISSAPVAHDNKCIPLLEELVRLVTDQTMHQRRVLADLGPLTVELAAAMAERLIHGAIAGNRQRLDRIVAAMLERMPASRAVTVSCHPQDLALLEGQLAQQADGGRYREILTCRPDDQCQRGQLKLQTDDWFALWDTPRCLAELRASLLEETFQEE